jgi:3-oxoacyl-[acyl-carrier protein] reductase
VTEGKLVGKNAIVTGAARGLGRTFALRLASLGARVAIVDKDLKSFRDFAAEQNLMTAESVMDEIIQAGGEAIGIALDVTDRDAQMAMAKEVNDTWGSIDVLVANAGGSSGSIQTSQASELEPFQLEEVLQRNLYGTIYSCNAVAPYMKKQRSGKIVTLGSAAGSQSSALGVLAHYGTAKAGVAMYTRYLAQDLGRYGITSNCIAPGRIATGRIMQNIAPDSSLNVADIPLGRVGEIEDVAGVVEFLTTDLSSYVNGAVIPVDGGMNHGAA